MKNGAKVEINKRNDKIQKTGRAELPTEINAVSQRPEKETSPNSTKGKKRAGNVSKSKEAAPKINEKKLRKPKKGCFRSRDDVHAISMAIFIRSLLYSRHGQDKARTLFIPDTQKKRH